MRLKLTANFHQGKGKLKAECQRRFFFVAPHRLDSKTTWLPVVPIRDILHYMQGSKSSSGKWVLGLLLTLTRSLAFDSKTFETIIKWFLVAFISSKSRISHTKNPEGGFFFRVAIPHFGSSCARREKLVFLSLFGRSKFGRVF